MLTVIKVFTFLSTLPVWEYPSSFQSKFFQISTQVYSVPGQTERRRKAFLEWKSVDLSYERSLTCRRSVNYYKNVHHPIPTRVQIYSLLGETEGKRKAFLEECKK